MRNGGACFCPVFCKCAQHLGIFLSKSNFLTKKNLRALNFRLLMTTFLPPTPQKVKTLPWKEREFPRALIWERGHRHGSGHGCLCESSHSPWKPPTQGGRVHSSRPQLAPAQFGLCHLDKTQPATLAKREWLSFEMDQRSSRKNSRRHDCKYLSKLQ